MKGRKSLLAEPAEYLAARWRVAPAGASIVRIIALAPALMARVIWDCMSVMFALG